MKDKLLTIGGYALLIGSVGGIALSAVFMQPLIPVFIATGGAGASLIKRKVLAKCLEKKPAHSGLSVNTSLSQAGQESPKRVRRHLRVDLAQAQATLAAQAIQKPGEPPARDMSLHRHESWHQDGQVITHDEHYTRHTQHP